MLKNLSQWDSSLTLLFFIISSLLLFSKTTIDATVKACPAVTTLEELITCLTDSTHMPRENSNGFVPPISSEQDDWSNVVTLMLNGTLDNTCATISLPSSLANLYEIVEFTDAINGKSYCVLVELNEVGVAEKKSWGTFITSLAPERELAIQITHPLHDLETDDQGIEVFKSVGARTFLLAGAHRQANTASSLCQNTFSESDVAHDVHNAFQTMVEALLNWYQAQGIADELVSIQFHGLGTLSCDGADIYMTYGRPPGDGTPLPGDDLLTLQAKLLADHPSWSVVVPGDPRSCALHGSTNVQGRLLNGVDAFSVCSQAARSYSARFIHIEQKRDFRASSDWISAIEATWRKKGRP